jgi:hypothetical protein
MHGDDSEATMSIETKRYFDFGVRMLGASYVAGSRAFVFSLLFTPFLVLSVLGLFAPALAIIALTEMLLGTSSRDSLSAAAAFWPALIYVAIFGYQMTRAGLPNRRSLQELLLGAVAMVAFGVAVTHIASTRVTETRSRGIDAEVLAFVRHNDIVIREVGKSAEVRVSARTERRDGTVMYDIYAFGTSTTHAIVEISHEGRSPRITLACTTKLSLGQRDNSKHPCRQ